ncbi:hypothetical protein K491DRAFT_715771 [Lophiostoma macrostomum CBS 122681]|uniref:Uncharacterized protein n=1 Tax=Lophiostoma macrostomum CBS 122681 TaxID=1314788 RepID=A0A6A6T8E2_9PLEO|nr:hypothetical protein K491DRAFT_715771 [Lophiostoma macrostomum CBS 122681]
MATLEVRQAQLLDFIPRLNDKAKEAAFGLYTFKYFVEEQAHAIVGLFHSLLSITVVIPELRKLLQVHPPLFTEHQVSRLDELFSDVCTVLGWVQTAIKAADCFLHPSTDVPRRVKQSFPCVSLNNHEQALNACFREAFSIVVGAKVAHMDRYGFLEDERVFECLRLREVMRQTGNNDIPHGLRDSLPVPAPALPGVASTFTPVQPADPALLPLPAPFISSVDVIELQHPKGFRGRYGHPDYPLAEKKAYIQLQPPEPGVDFAESFEEAELRRYQLRQEGRYPDIASFGIWPPISIQPNSVQDFQLRASMSDDSQGPPVAQASSAPDTPVMTPTSTRDSTPASDTDDNTVTGVADLVSDAGKEKAAPSTDTDSDQAKLASPPSVIDCANEVLKSVEGSASISGGSGSGETSTTPDASTVFQPSPPQDDASTNDSPDVSAPAPIPTAATGDAEQDKRLEAYFIYPTSGNARRGVQIWYEIQSLPLQNEAIKTHLQHFESGYSVINAIGDLLPEQLRLVLDKVTNRHGHLLSVQCTHDVDLDTKMGTFKLQAIIFVLGTSSPPEGTKEPNHMSPATTSNPFPSLFGINPSGGNTNNNNSSYFGGFGNLGRPSESVFGVQPTKDSFNPSGSSTALPISTDVNAYIETLKQRGDPCQCVEANPLPTYSDGALHHYQSITAMPAYSNHSFEELQLEDRKAGLTGPGSGIVQGDERNVSSNTLGGGNLFGSQPSIPLTYQGLVDRSLKSQQSEKSPYEAAYPLHPGLGHLGGLIKNGPDVPVSSSPLKPVQAASSGSSGLFGGSNKTITAPSQVTSVALPNSTTSSAGGGLFGTSSAGGGSFGTSSAKGGLFGTSSTDGLFGSSNKDQNTKQSSAFGGVPPTFEAPSLFGNTRSSSTLPSSGLFGQPRRPNSSGLFSNPFRSYTPAPTSNLAGFGTLGSGGTSRQSGDSHVGPQPSLFGLGGLFGGSGTTSSGGHFGQPHGTSSTAPSQSTSLTGGLFGSTGTRDTGPGGTLFGGSRPAPGGLFDSSVPAPPTRSTSGGLFGSAPASALSINAHPASKIDVFGSLGPAPAPASSSGLFANLGVSNVSPMIRTSGPPLFGTSSTTAGAHISAPSLFSNYAGSSATPASSSGSPLFGTSAKTAAAPVSATSLFDSLGGSGNAVASGAHSPFRVVTPSAPPTDVAPAPAASTNDCADVIAQLRNASAASSSESEPAESTAPLDIYAPKAAAKCKNCETLLAGHTQLELVLGSCDVCSLKWYTTTCMICVPRLDGIRAQARSGLAGVEAHASMGGSASVAGQGDGGGVAIGGGEAGDEGDDGHVDHGDEDEGDGGQNPTVEDATEEDEL